VQIRGKAGSGKSTDLMNLTFNLIQNDNNVKYLTYNNVLVFEISKIVSKLKNELSSKDIVSKEFSVSTIHSFIFQLARSLGTIKLVFSERVIEIMEHVKAMVVQLHQILKKKLKKGVEIGVSDLESALQGEKMDPILLDFSNQYIHFFRSKYSKEKMSLKKAWSLYYDYVNKKLVSDLEGEIFLIEYDRILKKILDQIDETETFYEEYLVEDKLEVLESTGKIADSYKEDQKLSLEAFKNYTDRRVNGLKRKRITMIDEAQDCTIDEKDLLISIFGNSNIVVTDGGKEQIVRGNGLCNWTSHRGRKISYYQPPVKYRTFRMKKEIVDLCNFLGQRLSIDLGIKSENDSEDVGQIIIDFRSRNFDRYADTISNLNEKGLSYGCSNYESLLILLSSNGQRNEFNKGQDLGEKAYINDFGNVELRNKTLRGQWQFESELEKRGFRFWNGTLNSKSKSELPSSDEIRYIFYESARGLEAWCVACYSLDSFFVNKMQEEEALNFSADDLFLMADRDLQKRTYAMNWVLMALTRAIDTIYIQIDNQSSEIGRALEEYGKLNPNVKTIY